MRPLVKWPDRLLLSLYQLRGCYVVPTKFTKINLPLELLKDKRKETLLPDNGCLKFEISSWLNGGKVHMAEQVRVTTWSSLFCSLSQRSKLLYWFQDLASWSRRLLS